MSIKAENILPNPKRYILCLLLSALILPGCAHMYPASLYERLTTNTETPGRIFDQAGRGKLLEMNQVGLIDSVKPDNSSAEYEDGTDFWSNSLQPILVTAGAAVVILLFFLIRS